MEAKTRVEGVERRSQEGLCGWGGGADGAERSSRGVEAVQVDFPHVISVQVPKDLVSCRNASCLRDRRPLPRGP